MKKNNKGFTLVELLAVIVILAIIMTIAGTNLLGTKKEANIEEAKKMEQMIEDLGPGIYTYEKLNGVKDKKSYCKKKYNVTYDEANNVCLGTSDLATDYDNYFNQKKSYNKKISLEELYKAGYLKEVVKDGIDFKGLKNPSGGEACTGYLEVSDGGKKYAARLSCPGLYKDGLYPNISTEVKLSYKEQLFFLFYGRITS